MKKINLLIVLLIVSLVLASCQNNDAGGYVATDDNTTAESTNSTLQAPTEPPEWIMCNYRYFAVVTITEKTDEVKKLQPKGNYETLVDYKKYRCYIDHSMFYEFLNCDVYIDSENSFWGVAEIYLADNEKNDVKAGDKIFVQISEIVMDGKTYYSGVINDSCEAEYLKFSHDKVLIDDNALQTKSFMLIATINKEIEYRLKSDAKSATPSFPKKPLYGEVTVDDIEEYFRAFKIALEEYEVYRSDITNK